MANISGIDDNIQNRPSTSSTAIPFAFSEKSELWFTNFVDLMVQSYVLKSTFLEDHILAPRGCCTPKFLHTLENDGVLLLHQS